VCDERLLQRMQLIAARPGQPLDGDDVSIFMGDGERQATIDPPPIEQDGAGAALAVIAALLGTGDAHALT
jgi:hypothetical protein